MDLAHLSTWWTIGSLVWAAYLLVLAVWIVLQKRSPFATLAWLFALAALPVLGFVVYFFLGPQKIKRQRLRRQRLRQQSRCEASAAPELEAGLRRRKQRLSRLVEKATGAPLASAERIDLLVDGKATFAALLQAIATARQHVHLEYYIFEPDDVGQKVIQALCDAVERGVQVRLLVDAVGSPRMRGRRLRALRRAGLEVARFHPFRLATLRPLLNLRCHRKIAVIDGVIGFTGGINISAEQSGSSATEGWHDLHLRVQGPVVGWLQGVFAEDWLYATRRPLPEKDLYPPLAAGQLSAQVVASGPDSDAEAIHRCYLQAISDARQRVWLVTPYFSPGEAALYALSNAALRGVDVRLLLPQRSDSRIVSACARSYYDELLARGVKIYQYPARMLHAKAMLVDDDCALVGSANFDLRSFRLNFEIALLVYEPNFVRDLSAQLSADFEASDRQHLPRRLSHWDRLAEAGARLLSPIL
ncbi:cardiolipin synthase [Pseudomarimonas arenosa]|uniref:Cardiolipin synthase n=1 Tax=Pseudomarimonas arenosa TaxID=2774145 RepID=A0AAW3ZSD8_9GAMM|nr:cardiolipin synthase [Pseudomarimonas arenosa]MBD8527964.1 cardiolipin synthase [Pseudomarimonas arenosa]